jgi:transposase InsO family protein
VAPNLLDQDFTATGPDEKWGADISYVWTREGWLYLAVIIDLFARRVVGWATGDRLHRNLEHDPKSLNQKEVFADLVL